MPNPLPNTPTTQNFRDTILSAGGPCQSGNILVANNPCQILVQSGPEQGQLRETLYPYIAPSIFPLAAGRNEFIWSVAFADFIAGTHAQVSGWLVPDGLAGPLGGNPFTGTISSSGAVTPPVAAGQEITYAEITANVTVSGTEPAPNTVVDSGSLSYDGSAILIEFYCEAMITAAALGAALIVNLWDGATDLGRLGALQTPAAAALAAPGYFARRLTPTAASHDFLVRAWQSLGNGTIVAGAGGVGTPMPAFIRITKI